MPTGRDCDRLLCSLAKKAGAPSPCRLFCLDPLEGLVQGVRPGAGFGVAETVYDGERCSVRGVTTHAPVLP
jgi:hypothetical protein